MKPGWLGGHGGRRAVVDGLCQELDGAAALYRLDATMTVTLEWRPQGLDAARRKIRGAQRHYFSKRYSMAAHVQETEGSAAAMVDTAAAAESERLGDRP